MNAHCMSLRPFLAMALSVGAIFGQAQDVLVGPPIRTDAGRGTFAANETSAASVDAWGKEIITSWNDWSESTSAEVIRCGVGLSSNAALTWSDFTLRPPVANRSGVEGDPFTIYDRRTGNLWAGAISFAGNGGVYIARKTTGSNTFQPSVMIQASSSADKIWGAAGPLPGNPNSTRLYAAYNLGVARSDDLGATWQPPVAIGSGLGFNPRVGPEGNVYVSFWDFGTDQFRLRRSTNGGNSYLAAQTLLTRVGTWGTGDCPIIPGNFRAPALPCIAVDPVTGAAYCVSFDSGNLVGSNRNADLFFQKSVDGGATWTSPTPIFRNTALSRDHFFPWVEVDRTGRIHVLYYSTEALSQNDSTSTSCVADAWYAYSDNGGATWGRERLTPASFNLMNDGLARSMAFYGDYLGMAWGGQRVYPHYVASWPNADPDNYVNVVINPSTPPITVSTHAGSYVSGNADSACQDDGNRFVIRSSRATPGSPFAGATLDLVTGASTLNTLSVNVISSVTATARRGTLEEQIELFNVQTQSWEIVGTRPPSQVDSLFNVDVSVNPQRFFNVADRRVRARISWRTVGMSASGSWLSRINRFHAVVR